MVGVASYRGGFGRCSLKHNGNYHSCLGRTNRWRAGPGQADEWKSTQSFGRNDLLVLAKVADLVHTRIFQLPAEAELPEVQVDKS